MRASDYMMAGDFYFQHGEFANGLATYQQGLTREVATMQEREHMEKYMLLCKEEIK